MPITADESDRRRFLKLLYYLNDRHRDENWERITHDMSLFERPLSWPDRKPIVEILAWTLMPNHFHLLLREIKDGGIALFMQRLCGSMSAHHNAKNQEKGSIFQGGYRGCTVDDDHYLRYVVPYIVVKNVFELYPGGFLRASQEFEKAWIWAVETYPYSSLSTYATTTTSPIVSLHFLRDIVSSPKAFKNLSRDMILGKAERISLEEIMLLEFE